MLLLAAGCAPAPPPAPPPPVVIAPASPDTATPTATAAPAPPPPPGRRFVLETQPLFDDLDADTGPARCDFAHLRGKIGGASSPSRSPRRRPIACRAYPHYDRLGPALALSPGRGPAQSASRSRRRGAGASEGRATRRARSPGPTCSGASASRSPSRRARVLAAALPGRTRGPRRTPPSSLRERGPAERAKGGARWRGGAHHLPAEQPEGEEGDPRRCSQPLLHGQRPRLPGVRPPGRRGGEAGQRPPR